MDFVIVGGGLAGVTAARTLRALDPHAGITVLEAEPTPYYLRPGLIDVLAGRKALPEITPFPRAWYEHRGIAYRSGTPAVSLSPGTHRVEVASGESIPYDRLLLSPGAEALVPEIPGVQVPGAFTFRSAADAERIRTWAEGSRRAAVIGGGWLGIESARALRDLGLSVTLLERGPWLLCRQLDEGAATVLAGLLAAQGIEVKTGAISEAILGDSQVRGVRLEGGEVVNADLVLISAGIRPRTGLAAAAGLAVGRGIVVDDHLATSAPDVYAAGDGAEWRGKVYGIVPAAREQGEAAARNMLARGSVTYGGTAPSNRLKVAGVDLLCLGNTQPQGGALRELRAAEPEKGRYAKFVLGPEGELAGAILLGLPELAPPVEGLLEAGIPAEDDLRRLLAW